MTQVFAFAIIFGGTFLSALLLPLLVRPMLERLRVVDVPSERSSHERPVLRGLGLATLLAMALGFAITWFVLLGDLGTFEKAALLTVGIVSLLAGLLGLAEDFKGVSVFQRSLALLFIASAGASAVSYIFYLRDQGNPALWENAAIPGRVQIIIGDFPIWLLAMFAIYGVLFISGYINVANFMDGLNGISGLHGGVAGIAFAALGWVSGVAWLASAGLILAAAFLAFLPWNLSRRGGFLGDVGSYLLGGSVAIISFTALSSGLPFLATIGPMVIYFGDVGVTLVRRFRSGHKWDEPHKEHTYQVLQQTGLSHVTTSLVVAAFSLVTSTLGLLTVFTGTVGTIICLLLGFVALGVYLALPKLIARRIR